MTGWTYRWNLLLQEDSLKYVRSQGPCLSSVAAQCFQAVEFCFLRGSTSKRASLLLPFFFHSELELCPLCRTLSPSTRQDFIQRHHRRWLEEATWSRRLALCWSDFCGEMRFVKTKSNMENLEHPFQNTTTQQHSLFTQRFL